MEWPAPTADERELLLGFLQHKREEAIATAAGLDEDQLRWSPDGGLLPIIGILNHLAHVEWRWIEGRYSQVPFPEREEEFKVGRERTGPAVITAYRAQAARTDEIVRAAWAR